MGGLYKQTPTFPVIRNLQYAGDLPSLYNRVLPTMTSILAYQGCPIVTVSSQMEEGSKAIIWGFNIEKYAGYEERS